MNKSIGFIGGGRVTRILLQAFKNRNVQFNNIAVTDTNEDVLANLKKSFPEIQVDKTAVAACQDIVIISLHPPVVMESLELISDNLNTNSILISLAPKIDNRQDIIKAESGKEYCQAYPYATSFINEGYNPVCFSSDFSAECERADTRIT